MPTRPLGTGYDPNSGWPADDSTSIPWDSDVDLSGQFGPGGFAPNPKLTGPATGPPPGVSLSGPGGVGGNPTPNIDANLSARPAPASGPQFSGPQNPPLRNPPAVRTGPGPYTDVTPNAAAPGIWDRLKGFIPGILAGAGPAAVPALAAGGAAAGAWAEPRTPRVDPRISAAGTGGFDVEQPLGGGPQPAHPSTMRYPSWPSGAAPAPTSSTPLPARPVTPTPATAYGFPMPPVRPRAAPAAAGPAAVAQQPNLGNYAPIYQPNIARTGNVRGGRSGDSNAPMMGALDLSRLFQRPQQ